MLKVLARFSAVMALCAMALTEAHAGGIAGLTRSLGNLDAVRRISLDRPTLAPFSYVMFCEANPGDCHGGAAAAIAMTPRARQLIALVNRRVNRAIAPRFESGDTWSAGTASGDCEDYALTKRRALIEAGFPAASLLMAVARTFRGEGHAVLIARTSLGDLVLDNRTDLMRAWDRTDLSFVKIASSEDPHLWYAVR